LHDQQPGDVRGGCVHADHHAAAVRRAGRREGGARAGGGGGGGRAAREDDAEPDLRPPRAGRRPGGWVPRRAAGVDRRFLKDESAMPAHEPAPPPGVLRKVTWRLIPFLCLLYVFNILDRGNVSIAALKMPGDLGLSQAAFDWGYGLFYLGYLLFEVPSNL